MKNVNKLILKSGILLTVSLTLFFSSCKKNIETSETQLQTMSASGQSNIVSLQVATIVAFNIDKSKFPSGSGNSNNVSGGNGNFVTPPDNPDYFTLYDKDSIPALYVVNFGGDNGYTFISADYRYDPVCAVIPEGSGLHEGDTIPSALDNWISVVIEEIEFIRDGKYDNSKTASYLWSFYEPALLNFGFETIKPYEPEPDCGPTTETVYGPLLGVIHWGQGCTFKEQTPNMSCSGCSVNALTGCVATAMAQVIRYWQYPSGYNYSLMPNTSGNIHVQTLMRDCGDEVDMNYGCTASGAQMSKVDNAFRNDFDYSSAKHGDYVWTTVRDNIVANKPVILGGFHTRNTHRFLFVKWYSYDNGHAWVADGHRRVGNYCSSGNFLHMNWGWRNVFSSTNHNGWFTYHTWSVSGFNFQYARDMIYNINP